MITIIHGEDQVASKNKLQDIKDKYQGKDIITLDGKSVTLTDLKQALEAHSLFLLEKLVIIDNLLTRKPSKDKDELINYLTKNMFDVDFILSEDKEATSAVLKKVIKAQVYHFKPAGNIFKFVDNLQPEGGKKLVPILHELLKTESPEVIFVMIIRQLRYLLLAKDRSDDYLKDLQPWQKAKFMRQAGYFGEAQILLLYRKLLDIDYKIKTGKTPLTLRQLLDLFLLNL